MITTSARISGNLNGMSQVSGSMSGNGTMSGSMSVPRGIGSIPIATESTLGGIIVGGDLLITAEGRLSVDKATSVEGDNTRPITAAAVYTEIGNINALLATI